MPISRYHATDCANLKKEFDKKNGWDIKKQINLTKRLCAFGRFDCGATCLADFHLGRSQIGLQRIDPIPQAVGPLPFGVS